jgi:hypothetical protein
VRGEGGSGRGRELAAVVGAVWMKQAAAGIDWEKAISISGTLRNRNRMGLSEGRFFCIQIAY